MIKSEIKRLAEEAIPLLNKMFGEGFDFYFTEYCKSSEAVSGITLDLPGCTNPPMIRMEDLPDNATAEYVAEIVADSFRSVLRNFKEFPVRPELTRENILDNVVFQVLSRKRNRQLLKLQSHRIFLDLAAVFRLPIGAYEKNSLRTMLITNQIQGMFNLTVEDLAKAARRNTVAKFGIEFVNAQQMALGALMQKPWMPEPFDTVRMTESGLYTLTNSIHINGAALILIPDILEAIGEKAGMDYFLLPTSIHEVLIVKNDGLLTRKELKEIVYDGNRTGGLTKQEDILSDNVYFYSRKEKALIIV